MGGGVWQTVGRGLAAGQAALGQVPLCCYAVSTWMQGDIQD